MQPIQRQARLAGGLYLLLALTAPIGLIYVPGQLLVAGDATATADRLRASAWLLRVGVGSELFHQVVQVYLVLVLYRLFRPVHEGLARQLVALGALVSVPVVFATALTELGALLVVSGAPWLAAFPGPQLDALAYLARRISPREDAAEVRPHLVHALAEHVAVRPGEVHMLEDAVRQLRRRERIDAIAVVHQFDGERTARVGNRTRANRRKTAPTIESPNRRNAKSL